MAKKTSNLSGLINLSQSSVLNAEGRPSLSSLFSSSCSSAFLSDADEQLIVNVTFKTPVKIKACTVTSASTGEERPTKVRLFINQRRMDFDDVDGAKTTQTLDLSAPKSTREGTLLPLNYVKFQHVSSICVFVEDNAGAEQTNLAGVGFYGEPVSAMDMSEWKPIKG